MSKEAVHKWCEENLELKDPDFFFYAMYEKSWYSSDNHSNFKFRMGETDKAFDVVLLACAGGYGGAEENWAGVNLGSAASPETAQVLLDTALSIHNTSYRDIPDDKYKCKDHRRQPTTYPERGEQVHGIRDAD